MRPRFEDRDQVKKRINVAMHKDVKDKAAKIGGGNVSKGIEIAIKEFAKDTDDVEAKCAISG